jgi:hypothetical protein
VAALGSDEIAGSDIPRPINARSDGLPGHCVAQSPGLAITLGPRAYKFVAPGASAPPRTGAPPIMGLCASTKTGLDGVTREAGTGAPISCRVAAA